MARNPLIRKRPKMTGRGTGGHKSAGILDDFAIRKNVATKEGTIEKVPVNESDIANKKYVDDNVFTLPSLTSGSIIFSDGTTLAQDNANLFWDETNSRVGIKTTDPAALLDVGGWAGVPSDIELDPTDTGGANILGDFFIGNAEAGGIARYRIGSNSNTGFLQWNSYYNGTIQKQMDTSKPSFAIRFAGASDRIEFATSAAGTPVGFFDDRMVIYTDGTIRMGEVDGSNYVTVEPDGSIILTSTTGALLLSRMTTTQRDALTAVNGMLIYNSTTNAFNFYENGSWVTK